MYNTNAFTKQEAEEFAELMKTQFLKRWDFLKRHRDRLVKLDKQDYTAI